MNNTTPIVVELPADGPRYGTHASQTVQRVTLAAGFTGRWLRREGRARLASAVRQMRAFRRARRIRPDGKCIPGLAEKRPSGPVLLNSGRCLARRDLPALGPMPNAVNFETGLPGRPGGPDLRAYATNAQFPDIATPEDFGRVQQFIPSGAAI